MNILAVDDELNALEGLQSALHRALPEALIHTFRSGTAALAFAENTPCEVAFLDIEMRDMNGLELAKQLKDCHIHTNIVFVTGYSEYAIDAFGVNASGYLLKPASVEKVLESMENLRNPIIPKSTDMLRVQCFGNFEVFANNVPLTFRYSKTKELLAYLVDRKGAVITSGELIAVLWEDKEVTTSLRNQFRNLISDLVHTLRDHKAETVLVKANKGYAVDVEQMDCDYYSFIRNEAWAVNAYCSEYMSQYSWAEMTLGTLEQR